MSTDGPFSQAGQKGESIDDEENASCVGCAPGGVGHDARRSPCIRRRGRVRRASRGVFGGRAFDSGRRHVRRRGRIRSDARPERHDDGAAVRRNSDRGEQSFSHSVRYYARQRVAARRRRCWSSYGDSPNNLDGRPVLPKTAARRGNGSWSTNSSIAPARTRAATDSESASFIDRHLHTGSSGAVVHGGRRLGLRGRAYGERAATAATSRASTSRAIFLLRKLARCDREPRWRRLHLLRRCFGGANIRSRRQAGDFAPDQRRPGHADRRWVDAFYNLFDVQGDTAAPSMTKQHGTNAPVQNNVFYESKANTRRIRRAICGW